MTTMPEIPSEIKCSLLAELPQALQTLVSQAWETPKALHVTEKSIFDAVLQLGAQAMSVYLRGVGNGDQGDSVELDSGRTVHRLPTEHTRGYHSIFGRYQLSRVVYGSRAGQRLEWIPLDHRLQLPEGDFSYLLQQWTQRWVQEVPYAQVKGLFAEMFSVSLSVHTLERLSSTMGEAVSDFFPSVPPPPAEEEQELLVIQADHKGVAMRGAERPKSAQATSKPGVKTGEKRMALVVASYSVDRFPRTSEQMTALLMRAPGSDETPSPRPKPYAKRVRALLQRDEAGTTAPQTREGYEWLQQEVAQRHQPGQLIVMLADGQEALWTARQQFLPKLQYPIVEILDLMHVSGYLWEAVKLFYPDRGDQASKEVEKYLGYLLSGHLTSVIRSLKSQATRHHLSEKKRQRLQEIIDYWSKNQSRMNYREYLEQGYPIASGVIEGACRSVVKDRMERSGMRWTLAGASAVLALRSVHSSHLWEAFTHFDIERQQRQRFPHLPKISANDEVDLTLRKLG